MIGSASSKPDRHSRAYFSAKSGPDDGRASPSVTKPDVVAKQMETLWAEHYRFAYRARAKLEFRLAHKPMFEKYVRDLDNMASHGWNSFKETVSGWLPVDHDSLHIHVGIAVFVILAWYLRNRPKGLEISWLLLFFLQIGNEILDGQQWIGWTGHVNWPEAINDTINTLFWPTVAIVGLWLWRRSAWSLVDPDVK